MQRASLAWQNLSKGLPLRAMLIDARCILRSAEEVDIEAEKARKKALRAAGLGDPGLALRQTKQMLDEGRVKDLLQSEMREELRKRGINTVGKPWELRARLTALLEAEAVGIRSPTAAENHAAAAAAAAEAVATGATSPPSPPPTPPTPPAAAEEDAAPSVSGEASSAAEKRAQYAAKLRLRTGASVMKDGSIVAPSSLKSAPLADNMRPVDNDGHFRFQQGARDFLTYLDMRCIARALLPSPDMETEAAALAQAEALAKMLQVPPFAFVLGRDDAERARQGQKSALLQAHGALGLDLTSELMLVSDDRGLLRASKSARIFSCHFVRKIPGAPKSLPSNYRAETLEQVQHAIEDLNGVTFRGPDTEIRTKFGVSVT